MEPRLPPRFGFFALIFLCLTAATLFGGSQFFSPAQAQDEIDTVSAAAPQDLTVSIVHTKPTHRGESITFTATVNVDDVSGLSFDWTFGDGNTAAGQVVAHTYQLSGSFPVRVAVSDDTEQVTASVIMNITIPPTPTTAPPGKVSIIVLDPPPLEAQQVINFQASVDGGSNVEFTWDFGDGSPPVTGSTVSHEYAQPKTYVVRVTARNSKGSSSASKTIVINDATPEGLSFTFDPEPAQIGENIIFNATVTRGTNVNYRWFISDGTSRFGQRISHVFAEPGEYEIRVAATNRSGGTEFSRTIIVRVRAPDSLRILQDSPKDIGEQVNVFISVNSQAAVTFHIDWGDGRVEIITVQPDSPGQRVYQLDRPQSYSRSGNYSLIVTAMNDSGFVDATEVIYIQTAKHAQTLDEIAGPGLIFPGHPAEYRITMANREQFECTWTIYDGKSKTVYIGLDIVHTYKRAGGHTVSVICEAPDGSSTARDFVEHVSIPHYLPHVAHVGRGDDDPGRIVATSTSTPIPPTATPTPTDTPIPPTNTPVPPTDTPIPPTNTPVPPTVTPIPPTATPVPPTNTPVPPPTSTPTDLPGGTIP